MGNYRFRLSDMIPNAWFYMPTDMSKTRKHKSDKTTTSPKKKPPTSSFSPQSRTTYLSQTRYSYYITTDHQQPNRDERSNLQEQPRSSSSTKRSRRKAVYKPSPKKHGISSSFSSSHCSCHASNPDSPSYFSSSSSDEHSESKNATLGAAKFGSLSCRVTSSTPETTLDKKTEDSTKKVSKSTTSSKSKESKGHQPLSVKLVAQERSSTTSSTKQNQQNTTAPFGIRLRGKSPPRVTASKKLQHHRKSVTNNSGASISDSFAVVKSSLDPHRDFKDSMMKMIMENNLKKPKDLEDLLACYLSINKREYHDLIVKAFEQIWLDIAGIKI